MNTRTLFSVTSLGNNVSIALLLLRLVAGLGFILHGWSKIQSPFTWMGPDSFAPGFLLALAAFSEFGGGIAWILGLLTPLASLGIAATMTVAVYFHAFILGDPFVGSPGKGSYELALIYLCISLLFIVIGPGTFSLDKKFFGARLKVNNR